MTELTTEPSGPGLDRTGRDEKVCCPQSQQETGSDLESRRFLRPTVAAVVSWEIWCVTLWLPRGPCVFSQHLTYSTLTDMCKMPEPALICFLRIWMMSAAEWTIVTISVAVLLLLICYGVFFSSSKFAFSKLVCSAVAPRFSLTLSSCFNSKNFARHFKIVSSSSRLLRKKTFANYGSCLKQCFSTTVLRNTSVPWDLT